MKLPVYRIASTVADQIRNIGRRIFPRDDYQIVERGTLLELRIGRTGRAGRAGVAVTFLGREDRSLVRQIERFTGNKVAMMVIEGLEPRTRIDDAPNWRKKAPAPRSGSRSQAREGYRRYAR